MLNLDLFRVSVIILHNVSGSIVYMHLLGDDKILYIYTEIYVSTPCR